MLKTVQNMQTHAHKTYFTEILNVKDEKINKQTKNTKQMNVFEANKNTDQNDTAIQKQNIHIQTKGINNEMIKMHKVP